MFDPTVYAWALTACAEAAAAPSSWTRTSPKSCPRRCSMSVAHVGVQRASARADHVMHRGPLLLDQRGDTPALPATRCRPSRPSAPRTSVRPAAARPVGRQLRPRAGPPWAAGTRARRPPSVCAWCPPPECTSTVALIRAVGQSREHVFPSGSSSPCSPSPCARPNPPRAVRAKPAPSASWQARSADQA